MKQVREAWEWVERAKARAFLDQFGSRVFLILHSASQEWIERQQQLSTDLAMNEAPLRAIQSEQERRRRLYLVKNLRIEYMDLLSSFEAIAPDYLGLR